MSPQKPPLPSQESLAHELIRLWAATQNDPDIAARPHPFTPPIPERAVELVPPGWPRPQRPGWTRVETLREVPSGCDRLVSVGLWSQAAMSPAMASSLVRDVDLSPYAVWTLIDLELPLGRRLDLPRRLGIRRLERDGWAPRVDVLRTLDGLGWTPRSADRRRVSWGLPFGARPVTSPLTDQGGWGPSCVDVVATDVWQAPDRPSRGPASGLTPR